MKSLVSRNVRRHPVWLQTLSQRDAPTNEVSIVKGLFTLPTVSICWEDSILKYYGNDFDSPILTECVSSDWNRDSLGPASFPAANSSVPSYDRLEDSTCNVMLVSRIQAFFHCLYYQLAVCRGGFIIGPLRKGANSALDGKIDRSCYTNGWKVSTCKSQRPGK
jgi:hypothetical protein